MIKKQWWLFWRCAAITCLCLMLIFLFCFLKVDVHRHLFNQKYTSYLQLPTVTYGNHIPLPVFLPKDESKPHRQEFSPMFAFITQTEKCIPSPWMDENYVGNPRSCDCHVYVLSYREPCNDSDSMSRSHVFYLHNNESVGWSGGRNLAFFEAKKHGYLYYIFFDDDVTLTYNAYTPKKSIDNKIPPLRIFTEYLIRHRPAASGVEFIHVSGADKILDVWHKKCKRFYVPRAIPLYHYDALFNAFHKDIVDYVLPYYEKFDHVSFWLSQLHFCFQFQMVFYGRFEFVPYIIANNPLHRYTQRDHLKDMNIRRVMVENIRERTTKEYRNHTRFYYMMTTTTKDMKDAVICEDPPASRSPIIPYQRMEMPGLT